MGRLVQTIALTALGLAMASPVVAAPWMAVELNHAQRFMLRGTAANVVVANPAIADVNVIDAHSIVVVGRTFGTTEVIVTDHAGHMLLDSNIAVGQPENGAVTVYRGGVGENVNCSPRCQPQIHQP